jgi:5'-nucleotidase
MPVSFSLFGASSMKYQDSSTSPHGRRIFTNRNLRMGSIEAIGFDMDHTLAVYNTENFNHVCFDMAIERLIDAKDYPEIIRTVTWDPDAIIRGLIIDRKMGNLLKVDAYNHVTRARHGFRFLDKEEKRNLYPRGRIRTGSPRYRVFDTLFDMPEGCILSGLVDLKGQHPDLLPMSFSTLYDDIRQSVDTMHADGSLKAKITSNLGDFFLRDDDLVPTLEKFRAAGKKLFLLTNSEADYTGAVMNYLVGGGEGSWESLFDLVVCFARKPKYFVASGPGEPIIPGQYATLPNAASNSFIGGDSFFLEQQLGISGDEILYFGDHTYGDILRSKKSVGWRTAMIVPEVEDEVAALDSVREPWQELGALEEALEVLVMERDYLGNVPGSGKDRDEELASSISDILGRRASLQRQIRRVFNPHWESLFREGRAASRFGRQSTEFACIYTSRVSNFLHYPVDKFFSRPVEVLPHERWAMPEA